MFVPAGLSWIVVAPEMAATEFVTGLAAPLWYCAASVSWTEKLAETCDVPGLLLRPQPTESPLALAGAAGNQLIWALAKAVALQPLPAIGIAPAGDAASGAAIIAAAAAMIRRFLNLFMMFFPRRLPNDLRHPRVAQADPHERGLLSKD